MLNFEHRTSKQPALRGFCDTFAWEIGAREGAIYGGKLKKLKCLSKFQSFLLIKTKKQRSQQPKLTINGLIERLKP